MKLHTSRKKPDWQYESTGDLTRWQSIAVATRGIITPGNIISVGGLLVVIYGAILLYQSSTITGLLLVVLGRIMDLVDGIVAEYTKTKSQLGEIVDTTCDKLSIIVTAVAAYSANLFPIELLIILFLHHTYTALYSVLFARQYRIHTTRSGKYAMFASWVAIILAIFSTIINNRTITIITAVVIAGYAVMALVACINYYRVLQNKIVERLRAAQWTRDIAVIIYVYNKKATNYKRAQRWVDRIVKRTKQEHIDMSIAEAKDKLITTIQKYSSANNKVLVAVAGGDGTVSTIANMLLKSKDKKLLQNSYLLPLWGGNANDLAYMLNGYSSNNTPHRLLAQSAPVTIPAIKVLFKKGSYKQEIFACCYASFGASAYAAKQLDKKRIATNKLVHYFPLLVLARELAAVAKALNDAPMFNTNAGNAKLKIYEHTFINGSRIAKVNRVPLSLSEPAFFHAAIDRKHPSFIIEVLRIIAKRSKKQYVKRQTVSFTVHDNVDAQIDGEVYPVEAGTKITISVHSINLVCISTKL